MRVVESLMACHPAEISRTQKTQAIRVLDVVLIGPLMLMGGMELEKHGDRLMGGLLSFFAISTIVYNAKNWFTVNQSLQEERMFRMNLGPGSADRRRT